MLCTDCNYCYGCVGLDRKEFHILNQPYSRREYFEIVKHLKEQWRRKRPGRMWCGRRGVGWTAASMRSSARAYRETRHVRGALSGFSTWAIRPPTERLP